MRDREPPLFSKIREIDDFVAYIVTWKIVAIAALAIVLTVASLLLAMADEKSFAGPRRGGQFVNEIGWASAVFFGFGTLFRLSRLFSDREHVRIGMRGILLSFRTDSFIPWSEIADVKVKRQNWWRGVSSIRLVLKESSSLERSRLRGFMDVLNGGLSFTLFETNQNFDVALAAIERFRSLHAAPDRST